MGPGVRYLNPDPGSSTWIRAALDQIRVVVDGDAEAVDRATLARSLVTAAARARRWEPPERAWWWIGPVDATLASVELSAEACTPRGLGAIYEQTLDGSDRAAGAHYTPPDVAAGVVGLLGSRLAELPGAPGPTVWDPACGAGSFLVAIADRLHEAGVPVDAIVSKLLWGGDTDPGAVVVAAAALSLWAWEKGVEATPDRLHLSVGDALHDPRPGPSRGFDVVVGNPPFQGQMVGASIRDGDQREALRARWGSAVGPYTDTASLFLACGVEALAPGGRLTMILPMSVLAARDSAAVRRLVTDSADLVGLWVAVDQVFDASVDVCAPVLLSRGGEVGGTPSSHSPTPINRWRGRDFTLLDEAPAPDIAGLDAEVGPTGGVAGSVGGSWSALALAALGVPGSAHRASGTLGDLCSAAAGFRDEYYGLVGLVHEASVADIADLPATLAPLVTSGLVDPGRLWWGERATRFGGQSWSRPVVDRAALAAAGGRAAVWAASTRGPKVVVASQTRVGEAAVDLIGSWLPSTPTVVLRRRVNEGMGLLGGEQIGEPTLAHGMVKTEEVDPETDEVFLWRVAAVVCSPVATSVLMGWGAGAGRSACAIRATVASLLALPTPIDEESWDAGARALSAGHIDLFASSMAAAFGRRPDTELERWWRSRLPERMTRTSR
ncbi:MAG: N-6 DNA methylase [Acidimicrobiales bacterium]